MATEKELDPGTNRHGEEPLELISNSAPLVLSFNEKTGKAARGSRLNAPLDAPAPNQALSAPDAESGFAASDGHNEFAPLPIPDVSERVTAGTDANGESRVFAAPDESSANLRLQPAAGSQSTDNRIMIEAALPPSARVQAPGAEIRSHRELVSDTSASASILQEHKVPQMASTVFVPVPEKAQRVSLGETAADPARRSAARPGNSNTGAPAPEFVPGLPATPMIVYASPEIERTPSPALSEPPPEDRASVLSKASAFLPGGQQKDRTAAAAQQHTSGERPRVDALTNGALAAPEARLSPDTRSATTLSISAAAVERLHAEEKKTSELNRQLDQLAARMKEPRH